MTAIGTPTLLTVRFLLERAAARFISSAREAGPLVLLAHHDTTDLSPFFLFDFSSRFQKDRKLPIRDRCVRVKFSRIYLSRALFARSKSNLARGDAHKDVTAIITIIAVVVAILLSRLRNGCRTKSRARWQSVAFPADTFECTGCVLETTCFFLFRAVNIRYIIAQIIFNVKKTIITYCHKFHAESTVYFND